jgi:O-antigen ligase
MVGACVNAALVILQIRRIWSPFVNEEIVDPHYASGGFLGNTNYVGTFLAAPALAAIVVAVIVTGRRRWAYAAIATLLVTGVVLSASRTAAGALVAGLVVFFARSRRGALAVVAAIVVVALVSLSTKTALGVRARDLVDAASKRDYERLFSERLLPGLAAIDMIRDHPMVGVGPGCFRFHFMAYRLRLDDHYPKAWTRGYPGNWSAVHNDHLQVAAETGLPGYALFLGGIAIGAGWRRRRTAPPRIEASFARAMRWPLAALIFVLCLAQFPLELAAPRLMLLSLGALCIHWDQDDASA